MTMQSNEKNVREVTLAEILNARERRAALQKKILSEHDGALISFTMNIAGPIKSTPLIERAFQYGLSKLISSLPRNKIIFECSRSEPQGCESMMSVNLNAETIKNICVDIEQSSRLGRLFDMDVIAKNGEKLERKRERACIVCGKVGRECSAGRLHPVEEIVAVTDKIMTEHFAHIDAERIGELAAECLIREVKTTPKPGLVDLRNNGSHTDMDVNSFIKSAVSLKPYFTECIRIGIENKNHTHAETFKHLREAGIRAEKTMYEVTNGINTHKGLIYSLGVLLCALGRHWKAEQPISDRCVVLSEASALVRESAIADLASANGTTAGEKLFLEYGLQGIRGEVASGFSSVKNYSLPIYEKALIAGISQNDAGVHSLISLISAIDDTNLYHRGGAEGARFAKEYAKRLLEDGFDSKAVEQMDDEFIKRNLSPGGSADLLAITYFLHSLEEMQSQNEAELNLKF